jgi:glycosyltransferase involved in cell wall biosynthesis
VLRAALRGRAEARRVLAEPADATVFNTQVPAVVGGRAVRRDPYFLCCDVTPIQYDEMAAGYEHRADRTGPLKWWKHSQNRAAFRGAACNLVWSAWVRESLIADYGVDPARIEVLPPGVDTTTWQPRVWQPVSGADGGPVRILFVGGDFERKGGDALIRAFRSLAPGSAELTVVTRSEIEPSDHVRVVTGLSANDPRLIELYRDSDVFVLPSLAETFGIAYVEASAAGLPVVGSRIGGVSDIVVDDETGYTVSPGDESGLVACLTRLVGDRDLRRRLGHAARARAVERFDATTNARRLIDLVRGHVPFAARDDPHGS